MADNTGKRAEANELAENDPFAELTRIMGYDQDAKPAEEPAEDLALELEKELMGDVLDVPEENTGAEVIFWKQPPNIPAQPEPVSEEQFGSTFEPVVDVDEHRVAADEPHEVVVEPQDHQDHNVFTLHENDLLTDGWPVETASASATPEPQEYQEEPQPDHFGSTGESPYVAFAAAAQEYEAAPDAGSQDNGASLDYSHASAEPQDYREEPQPDHFGSAGELPYAGFAEPAREYEAAPDAGGQDDGASLDYFRAPAEPQDYREEPQPDHVDPADEVPYVGFAAAAQEHEAAPDIGDEDDSASFDYSRAAAERHEFLTVDDLSASLAELGNFETEMEPAPSEPAPLQEEAAHEEWQPQQFSPIELSTEWSHGVADDGYSAHQDSSNNDDLAPAIETVDVPEKAVAVADNFDIPDVPYKEEKPAAHFDEIEEILAGAFGDMSTPTEQSGDTWADDSLPEATMPSSFSDEQPQEDHSDGIPGIAAVAGAAAAYDSHALAGQEQGAGYHHGPDAAYQNGWSPQHQHAQLTPEPGVEPPVEAGGFRVGPYLRMAGALAGAVAILGGVTYFALNFGDSSSGGEPVLIAADPSPVKERPEEPGGVEIPNQDNQVYRRVSGEQIDNQPEQARLISATEDPVALPPAGQNGSQSSAASPEGETVALAPLPGDNSSDTAAEPAKSEDRLSGGASSQTNDSADVVSLAPRRVRSMVVRPDGTMVPYEAPAPVASAPASDAAEASEAAALESEAGALPSNAMPATGPIPPSRPANIAAAQPLRTTAPAQQQPAQQAAVQPAPAAPAPAAQPASSAWSVQIASQPSIESAQQSYQQMAQRFGNLLQGRGVNIVKADIDGRGTFYRVRIPSASKDDAIQLCSQLKSTGGSCFVSQ